MKTMPASRQIRKTCLAALAACLLAGYQAGAQNYDTWTGGGSDGYWQDANNWGGTAPVAGDYLFFDTGNNLLATNNYANGTIFGNVTFNGGGGAFTLSGNPIVLGNGIESTSGVLYGGGISNASPANEIISASVTNANGNHQVVTTSGSGQLTLPATFANNIGATVEFFQLGGAINSTLANNSAGVLGGWAVYTTSANSLINNNQNGSSVINWATNNAGVLAACTIYTNLSGNAAAIINNPAANVKVTSGGTSGHDDTMKTSGTTTVNSIYWDGTSFSGSTFLDIPTGDILRLGAQGGVVANLNHFLRIGNNLGSLTAGGAANTPGQIYVYNVSAYASGQVEFWCNINDNGTGYPVSMIFNGSAELDDADGYSGGTYVLAGDLNQNGSSDVFGYGPIYVYPGGRVDLGNQNSETLTNNFYIAGMGFLPGGAANTSSVDEPGAIKGTYTGTFKGAFTLMGNAWIDPNAGSQTCTFTGPFSGTGSLSIGGPVGYYVGGTAVMGNNLSYSGDTIMDATEGANGNGSSSAGIKIGAGDNNIMNNGGNLVLIGGATSGNPATFDLNGTTQTINGLVATNNLNSDNPVYSYVKSSAANGVLVAGNNNASSTFYGNVENGGGSLGLTKIGTGTVALDYQNTYTGPTVVSNGVLYAGSYSFDSDQITVVNPGLLDVSGFGTYNLGSGQTLGGNGAVNGGVSANNGSTVSPGLGGSGTLTISNTLTLNSSSLATFTLSSTTNGANCQIIADGGVTLSGGTVQIIASSTLQVGRYKLILYPAGNEGGSAANMSLSYSGTQSVGLDDSVPGEIDLVVSSAFVTQLKWQGDGVNNIWDINNTADWLNGAVTTVFTNGCAVTFNNSGSMSPAVNINGVTVQPLSIVVSNTTGVYTLGGGGNIAGGTGITKRGAGQLVLADSGGDSFAGNVVAAGGSVILSNANVNIGGNLVVSNGASMTAAYSGTINGALINAGTAVVNSSGTLGGGVASSGSLVISNTPAISGGLSVSGGTALLDQSGGATYTGGTTIGSGATVQFGNDDTGGLLPSGSLTENGSLVFDDNANVTVGNIIAGSGTLVVTTNSTVVQLTAQNSSFTGNLVVQGGTLQGWTQSTFGTTAGSIVVSNGATLDHGWDTTKPITVSGAGVGGNGAVVNNSSGNAIYDGSGGMTPSMTLAGNTTIGGNTRWDLGSPATLSTGGNNYNLALICTNGVYFEWDNVTIDTNLGNIDIYGTGTTLGIKGSGESLGNPTNVLTVHAGAGLDFWGESANNSGYAKNIYVQTNAEVEVRQTVTPLAANIALDAGGTLGVFDNTAQKNLTGAITLNGGLAHFEVGDTTQTINGIIGGPGGFYLDNYNNTLVFTATNTYTGETLVENGGVTLALATNGSIAQSTLIDIASGTLSVAGRTDGTLTLANGQTLQGGGKITGILVASAGSIVAPGTSPTNTAVLTVSSNVTLSGSSIFKLNTTTNDVLSSGFAMTYGGTLMLTNISATPLAAGNSFQLFNATSYSGAFSSISPVTPGPGLLWSTNNLTVNGTVSVVSSASAAVLTGISVNGTTLTLTATNGAMNGQFVLMETTNLAPPITWTPVLTNQFDGNGDLNLATNIINPNSPLEFYLLQMP